VHERVRRHYENEQRGSHQHRTNGSIARDQALPLLAARCSRKLGNERLKHEQSDELGRHVGNAIGGKPVTQLSRAELIAVHGAQREEHERGKAQRRSNRHRIAQQGAKASAGRPPFEPQSDDKWQCSKAANQWPRSESERRSRKAPPNDEECRGRRSGNHAEQLGSQALRDQLSAGENAPAHLARPRGKREKSEADNLLPELVAAGQQLRYLRAQ